MPKPKSRYTSIDKRSLGLTVGENVRPPPEVLLDRDRRRELLAACADPNVLLLGDPPVGRRAIDQRDPRPGSPPARPAPPQGRP